MNKVYNEDCVKTMTRLDRGSIDLVVTSPPYDDLRDYDGNSQFDLEAIVRGLFRVIKDGGIVVWIVGDQVKDYDESGSSFRQALYFKEIGFKLNDTMIFQKNNMKTPGSSFTYLSQFEYMFVFSKGKPQTINLIRDRKNMSKTRYRFQFMRTRDGNKMGKIDRVPPAENYGKRFNIWSYNCGYKQSSRDELAFEHPAIFPEALARDHIISWSNEGDLVYDPFLGSGTTAIVARKLRRRYLGSEINKEYFDLIQRRLKILENDFMMENVG